MCHSKFLLIVTYPEGFLAAGVATSHRWLLSTWNLWSEGCQTCFFFPLLRQLLEIYSNVCVLCHISTGQCYSRAKASTDFRTHICEYACFALCFVKRKANPLWRHLLHFGFLLFNIVFKEILEVNIPKFNILIYVKLHKSAFNSLEDWKQTISQSCLGTVRKIGYVLEGYLEFICHLCGTYTS